MKQLKKLLLIIIVIRMSIIQLKIIQDYYSILIIQKIGLVEHHMVGVIFNQQVLQVILVYMVI